MGTLTEQDISKKLSDIERNQSKILILLENIFKILSKYDQEYNEEIMEKHYP